MSDKELFLHGLSASERSLGQFNSTEDSSCSPMDIRNVNVVEVTNCETEENENVDNGEDDGDEKPYEKKKRKKTSKCRDDFKEVILKDGSKKAECIHCKARLAFNKDGATSTFLKYLKNCPRRHCSITGQQNISLISSKSESVSVVQNFKYDHAKIREITAHMILIHELPFNFTEYELFNFLIRTATPHYQKISRTMTKNDCVTAYEIEKKKIKVLLKYVSKVSVTTDLWKSGQKIQYMVLTCHFVDFDCKLQKRTLNFCDCLPPHTGVAIYDALYKCLVDWGIENKVCSITVDNVAYNDVAVRMLKDNISYQKQLPLGGQLFYVRCCAHITNLLVQDGLSEIEEIICNVRESVKYISVSETRLIMFSDIAKQLQLPTKKLILDCCTRWNATYAMLATALEFKDVFPRYQQRDSSYHSLPSDENFYGSWLMIEFFACLHSETTV